jgi:hypothetical protein
MSTYILSIHTLFYLPCSTYPVPMSTYSQYPLNLQPC